MLHIDVLEGRFQLPEGLSWYKIGLLLQRKFGTRQEILVLHLCQLHCRWKTWEYSICFPRNVSCPFFSLLSRSCLLCLCSRRNHGYQDDFSFLFILFITNASVTMARFNIDIIMVILNLIIVILSLIMFDICTMMICMLPVKQSIKVPFKSFSSLAPDYL